MGQTAMGQPVTNTASGNVVPVRLLVLGDSLTAGYGLPRAEGFQAQLAAALRARGIAVTVIDGAVSGDTSAGGLARMDWVLADGADAAIVELGANDGLRGLDPREMERNLTTILDRLAARKIRVLLSGMYPPSNYGPDYRREYRAVFDRLGQRRGRQARSARRLTVQPWGPGCAAALGTGPKPGRRTPAADSPPPVRRAPNERRHRHCARD